MKAFIRHRRDVRRDGEDSFQHFHHLEISLSTTKLSTNINLHDPPFFILQGGKIEGNMTKSQIGKKSLNSSRLALMEDPITSSSTGRTKK